MWRQLPPHSSLFLKFYSIRLEIPGHVVTGGKISRTW
jgi:hypothetical protein